MGFDNKDGFSLDSGNASLQKGLIDALGGIPVNDQNTALFIRATETNNEAANIVSGGYGFDRMGFAGNGVALGNVAQDNLRLIDQTHRGWNIVEFFAFPNIRRDVISKVQSAGLNHRDIPMETLFAEPYIPNQDQVVGQSGMMGNANEGLLVPNIFFKGYFDKTDNSWHQNSSYWETSLELKATEEGWSPEKLENTRSEMREVLTAKAMEKLGVAIEKKKNENESLENFMQ